VFVSHFELFHAVYASCETAEHIVS